jgi:hypothetical protein
MRLRSGHSVLNSESVRLPLPGNPHSPGHEATLELSYEESTGPAVET